MTRGYGGGERTVNSGHSASGLSVHQSPHEIAGLDRSGARTWTLFCDWCAATDHSPLPATPSTVAEFLDDHRAAVATQRRRVGVINTAHRRRGLTEPGRAVAIRLALAQHHRPRLAGIGDDIATIIDRLPRVGWPYGLFGRRDALILTLVAAGLTYADIAAVRRGDIGVDGPDLVIPGLHRITPELSGNRTGSDPVSVYRRWAHVQSWLDRSASISMLADILHPDRPPPPASGRPMRTLTAPQADEPLLVRIDRWGYTPWAPESLSAQSLSTLTRAHLTGQPPVHRPRIIRTANDTDEAVAQEITHDGADIVLDNFYYEHGVRARREAHTHLANIDDRFDEISDRADELLRRLADIIDDPDQEDDDA
ncbi:recombinase [Rhodococcoides yunnanense]|uniref:recombinase n=1 Tax=Rhodococcoides yunnanense TaxID=278209 RepID=UPI0022B11D6F|nr:recombinase [Rhodococcus yunnanensis]MCZ4278781.1 recombinase [Rhodococcus yunnanensis]